MKITVERDEFLKALSHAQSVVEKRTTVPILSHVMIDGSGSGEIQMTSTDLELVITKTIPATIHTPGKITVSAHMLFDIVRKLKDGSDLTLELQEESSQVTLISGRSDFSLSYLPADDFPAVKRGDLPLSFPIEAATLSKLLERTRFAMSTEETRYTLNGVYLHSNDNKTLSSVATDGHRLAKIDLPLPESTPEIPGAILSRKAVNAILRLVSDYAGEEGKLEIGLSDTQVSVKFEKGELLSRLIDGTFPDYEQVIPKQNSKILALDMKQFSKAVDRVATVASDKTRGIKLALAKDKITLRAASAEQGSAVEEIDVCYDEDPIEIGFNSRYLLDVAQHFEGSEAKVALSDSATPVTIQDANDNEALYVIMPMRVG